ncbi:cation:H+ antiporter [Cyclobacterium xiamenense]|jgi:cation:H+ antiporter|uniref:Cation:H+ antiporter n=1 Tax=Cyclobacterium xiamenense TaxID=1297121 RepID=A0A1H7AAE7_9BACT|nr:calcium/sodium antiporter [Cyclobacterium xiamenense]SEJ62561.1 cation:H+ antiporter [Cyclobacterium xiamenense]
MLLSLIVLVFGFVLLVYGADKLVEAATSIAARLSIPNSVIGLTVVAFGTSAPELSVNVMAAIEGSGEMVMANVLGSNVFNGLVILGLCAMIFPLTVKSATTWIEVPLSFLAALLVWILASDQWLDGGDINLVSRSEGLVLLLFFAVFLVYTLLVSKNPQSPTEEVSVTEMKLSHAVFWLLLGLAGLVVGGNFIVTNAIFLAQSIGLSERVIGLTVVSIGTSLPELATSLAAVKKKKVDIAIGNVVGSNIFNIFLILGLSSTIHPVLVNDGTFVDILVNCVAGLLLFVFIFSGKGRMLERWEGGVFVLLYGAYLSYLLFF